MAKLQDKPEHGIDGRGGKDFEKREKKDFQTRVENAIRNVTTGPDAADATFSVLQTCSTCKWSLLAPVGCSSPFTPRDTAVAKSRTCKTHTSIKSHATGKPVAASYG